MNSPREDPLVTSSRREASVAVVATFAVMAWSVGYCVRYGYGRKFADLTFVLGFPDWVFWGIVVPWGACVVLAIWMTFFFIQDEVLEDGTATVDDPAEFGDGNADSAGQVRHE